MTTWALQSCDGFFFFFQFSDISSNKSINRLNSKNNECINNESKCYLQAKCTQIIYG